MVVFETKFDENVTSALMEHQLKKIIPIFIIFSAIFIFLGVVLLLNESYDGLLIIAICVPFALLVILLSKFLQRSQNKSLSLLSSETNETYKFDENKIYIETTKGEDYSSSVVASYNYAYKVVETKQSYILYISRAQERTLLQKKDITEGTLGELNTLFAAKFGQKKFTPLRK